MHLVLFLATLPRAKLPGTPGKRSEIPWTGIVPAPVGSKVGKVLPMPPKQKIWKPLTPGQLFDVRGMENWAGVSKTSRHIMTH